MYVGTIVAWNPELSRGIIESAMTGETFKFTLACVTHTQDVLDMRAGIKVFFTTFQRHAPQVEIISSSFNRFVDELETDPQLNRRVLA